MALVPQFTTDTVADPITMNKLADAVNANTSAIGQIATEYIMQNAELLNGWIFLTETKIAKTKNIVTISGGIKDGTTISNTQLATIPLSFRPNTSKYFSSGMYGVGGSKSVLLRLGTDGALSIYNQAGDTSIFFNFSYII